MITPEIYSLRITSIEAINKLKSEFKIDFKTASHIYFILSKRKKLNTGFNNKKSFHNFYHNIIKFKSSTPTTVSISDVANDFQKATEIHSHIFSISKKIYSL